MEKVPDFHMKVVSVPPHGGRPCPPTWRSLLHHVEEVSVPPYGGRPCFPLPPRGPYLLTDKRLIALGPCQKVAGIVPVLFLYFSKGDPSGRACRGLAGPGLHWAVGCSVLRGYVRGWGGGEPCRPRRLHPAGNAGCNLASKHRITENEGKELRKE
jgi:hypothetical protein